MMIVGVVTNMLILLKQFILTACICTQIDHF